MTEFALRYNVRSLTQRYMSGTRRLVRILLTTVLALGWAISANPAAGTDVTLRVGIYQNSPKIFIDEAGQPAGFWPDLVDEISRQKGWTADYITCEWAACLKMLEEGGIDVMPDVAYSKARAAKFMFGKDVVFHSWSLIFHQPGEDISGILDLSGLRIAVLAGSIQEERLGQRLKEVGIEGKFVHVPSLRAALSAVSDGTADVAVVNRFFGTRLAPKFGLAPSGIVIAPSAVQFAFAPDVPSDVLTGFDDVIANLKLDGGSVYYKGLAELTATSSRTSIPTFIYWVIGTGFGLLCLTVGSVVVLRRAVAKRTAELQNEIHERAEVEDSLRDKEQRYRGVVEDTPVLICSYLPSGEITFANSAYCDYFAKSSEELVGSKFLSLLPESERESVMENISALTIGSPTQSHEHKVIAPSNEIRWQRWTNRALFDDHGKILNYQAIGEDITERRLAEEALRASEARFRSITENAPTAISLKDLEGRYLLINDRYCEWFGLSEEECLGQTHTSLLDQKASERVSDMDRTVVERGEPLQAEIEVPFADGTRHWLQLVKSPINDSQHQPASIMTIATDVTDRQHMEEQLRQSRKMEAVGQLTGGIAHDFNNLMGVMLGNVELLAKKVDENPAVQQHVEAIHKAISRAESLTDRLLAFSRQQTLAPQPTDVSGLISGLDDMLRRILGETIEVKVEFGTGLWLANIDPHQFENALVNLTINARDAMPDGGILVIETANVTLDENEARLVTDVPRGDYVTVSVRDSGTGMAPGLLEQAFEPFFTTKDVGKGSGLGLSMVYGFAKQSNGHASICSEVGHGTTVKLYLPRSVEDAAAQPVDDNIQDLPTGAERILVVEDNEDLRIIPSTILREQGYEVVEARDGAEALKQLEAAQRIDLVFTDIKLPGGMNGLEVARQAKRLHPNIRVIYTTGYAESAAVSGGEFDPEFNLMNKPYRRASLLEMIRSALDNARV